METLSDVFALDHVSKGYLKTSPRVTLVPLLFLVISLSRYSRLICIPTTRLEDFVSAEYTIDILMSPDRAARNAVCISLNFTTFHHTTYYLF